MWLHDHNTTATAEQRADLNKRDEEKRPIIRWPEVDDKEETSLDNDSELDKINGGRGLNRPLLTT